MTAERETSTEVVCASCGDWGVLREADPIRGFLIEHTNRRWPCRVPYNPKGPEA
jgi:hypothetical protein